MAEAGIEKSFRSPLGVTADDENNEIVRVCIVLPGLTKKFGKNKAKNGVVTVNFAERSLDVQVELTTKQGSAKNTENYRYTVKRLPDEILTDKSRYVVEKDKLVLFLQKASPRSWAAELDRTGLETDRPKDDD